MIVVVINIPFGQTTLQLIIKMKSKNKKHLIRFWLQPNRSFSQVNFRLGSEASKPQVNNDTKSKIETILHFIFTCISTPLWPAWSCSVSCAAYSCLQSPSGGAAAEHLGQEWQMETTVCGTLLAKVKSKVMFKIYFLLLGFQVFIFSHLQCCSKQSLKQSTQD